ncbi:MAG: DUF2799 domain-containing protein [Gammaproteobacteria bacterium]
MLRRSTAASYLIFITCLLLNGCATGSRGMSASECTEADWQAVGLADGRDGAHSGIGEQRFTQCEGASVAPDRAAYQKGLAAGLLEFCEPRGGFLHGVKGKEYAFNCAREQEPKFIRAYQIGYDEYELKQAVRDADRLVNRNRTDMQSAQTDVKRLEAQYYGSANASRSEINRINAELNRIRRRVLQLQGERAGHRAALDQAQTLLKKYRKTRPLIPGLDKDEATAASEQN